MNESISGLIQNIRSELGVHQNVCTEAFDVIDKCRALFMAKTEDYGTSWCILRPESITDQVWIKAWRVRQLQEKEVAMVKGESIEDSVIGIFNYSIMALVSIEKPSLDINLSLNEAMQLYGEQIEKCLTLMEKKNHDYGEAWKDMRLSGIVDIILMKLLRIKQLEENGYKAEVSEPVSAGYADIANYCIFILIKLKD